MNLLRLLPVIISSLLLAAHFSRADQTGLVLFSLTFPFLLFIRRQWVIKVCQIYLILGSFVWLQTLYTLVQKRIALEQPWGRLVLILGSVVLLTVASAFVFRNKKLNERYPDINYSVVPSALTFILTVILLGIVQLKVHPPMLLIERFFPGTGWIEILILASYSAFITEKMLDITQSARWRSIIWNLFSIVFFAQFIIGLAGVEKFLMSGQLHLPIPAMIIAGPIYRGARIFMPILLGITLVLVGPAWCSHLCYLGAWDKFAADQKKRPQSLPAWRIPIRWGIFVLVILAAVMLRIFKVPTIMAAVLGIIFGLVGVGIMLFWSRKTGVMAHCITYCPIGLIVNYLGRISPFRIRINSDCTECMRCRLVCRYDALQVADILNRKPGLTCTLCGDCLSTCHSNSFEYRFLALKPRTARFLFIILIVTLHTVFLGVARI
jgi:ferredoxin